MELNEKNKMDKMSAKEKKSLAYALSTNLAKTGKPQTQPGAGHSKLTKGLEKKREKNVKHLKKSFGLKEQIKDLVREIFEDKAPEEKPESGEGEKVSHVERQPSSDREDVLETAKMGYEFLKQVNSDLDEIVSHGLDMETIIRDELIHDILFAYLGSESNLAVEKMRTFPHYKQIINQIKNESGFDIDNMLNYITNYTDDIDEGLTQSDLVNEVLKRIKKNIK